MLQRALTWLIRQPGVTTAIVERGQPSKWKKTSRGERENYLKAIGKNRKLIQKIYQKNQF
jgi:aryl-alcohol dehydrogenase-like predicted oxidoreductase